MIRKFKIYFLALISISIFVPSRTDGIVLFQGPYVQNVSTHSAVLRWQSIMTVISKVRYGMSREMTLSASSSESSYFHELELDHLKPDTTYYYQIIYNWFSASDVFSFKTAPERSRTNFSFAVVGDTGSLSSGQFKIADLLERCDFDFLLHTGDVVYLDGALFDYPLKFLFPYRKILPSIPFFMTIGNHDAKSDRGKPYLKMFSLPHNNSENTELYYSFEWGNALFISLDSILSPFDKGSAQYEWLKNTLEQSRHPWRFVFFHIPLNTSSNRDIDAMRLAWAPLFEKYGVDIVFSGHDHYYERFQPIQDVIYIVTGGGGAHVKKDTEYDRHPASEVLIKKHHFVKVNVENDRLTLTAIDEGGNSIDQFPLRHTLEY